VSLHCIGHDGGVPPLDHDRCYAAAASRDARFDGHFVTAVKTTGIYCRPSCPAITPKRTNVEFHPTAAAAQQRGFRACKRCLPDATPGSPEWDLRRDVVGRAMRLIADGEIERSGVGGLAGRLGYSERHLNRLVTDDLGAGPLAIARARRAHTARLLIETTEMRLTDIAFAAGFGSVRQFNDTMREVYDSSPSDLRAAARRRDRGRVGGQPADGEPGRTPQLRLRLPVRAPFAGGALADWFAARAVPGLEEVGAPADSIRTIERTVRLPGGVADVRLEIDTREPGVVAEVVLDDPADLPTLVERMRRALDLDADPVAIDAHLSDDLILRPLVAGLPGLRSPGSFDGFETGVRAIVGQQVSVAGARTVLGQLVSDVARADDGPDQPPRLVFPDAAAIADAPDTAFAMPGRRRETIRRFAAAVASGELVLDAGADSAETRQQLLTLPGIGPWTADYIVLRALRDPDVALTTDLVAARTAAQFGIAANDLVRHAERWSPWRTYATHHLWAAAASPAHVPASTATRTSGETDR